MLQLPSDMSVLQNTIVQQLISNGNWLLNKLTKICMFCVIQRIRYIVFGLTYFTMAVSGEKYNIARSQQLFNKARKVCCCMNSNLSNVTSRLDLNNLAWFWTYVIAFTVSTRILRGYAFQNTLLLFLLIIIVVYNPLSILQQLLGDILCVYAGISSYCLDASFLSLCKDLNMIKYITASNYITYILESKQISWESTTVPETGARACLQQRPT